MDWITIIGPFRQGACLPPGDAPADPGQEPGAGEHLALALAAVAVTGVAGSEMQRIAVGNPADFARIIRWIHVPLMVLAGPSSASHRSLPLRLPWHARFW